MQQRGVCSKCDWWSLKCNPFWVDFLQAIKAKHEAEQKKKEKKAAMARPAPATPTHKSKSTAVHGDEHRPAGML